MPRLPASINPSISIFAFFVDGAVPLRLSFSHAHRRRIWSGRQASPCRRPNTEMRYRAQRSATFASSNKVRSRTFGLLRRKGSLRTRSSAKSNPDLSIITTRPVAVCPRAAPCVYRDQIAIVREHERYSSIVIRLLVCSPSRSM